MFTVRREVEMVKLNFEVFSYSREGSKFSSDNIILRKGQTSFLLEEPDNDENDKDDSPKAKTI